MDFLNRINELQNITVYYYTSFIKKIIKKKKKKKKTSEVHLYSKNWIDVMFWSQRQPVADERSVL
jgi:retron-type reverse transcriptase